MGGFFVMAGFAENGLSNRVFPIFSIPAISFFKGWKHCMMGFVSAQIRYKLVFYAVNRH